RHGGAPAGARPGCRLGGHPAGARPGDLARPALDGPPRTRPAAATWGTVPAPHGGLVGADLVLPEIRVWAPGAHAVDVVAGDRRTPMTAAPGGWFSAPA